MWNLFCSLGSPCRDSHNNQSATCGSEMRERMCQMCDTCFVVWIHHVEIATMVHFAVVTRQFLRLIKTHTITQLNYCSVTSLVTDCFKWSSMGMQDITFSFYSWQWPIGCWGFWSYTSRKCPKISVSFLVFSLPSLSRLHFCPDKTLTVFCWVSSNFLLFFTVLPWHSFLYFAIWKDTSTNVWVSKKNSWQWPPHPHRAGATRLQTDPQHGLKLCEPQMLMLGYPCNNTLYKQSLADTTANVTFISTTISTITVCSEQSKDG